MYERRRNREIPFPNNLLESGEFENYLVGLVTGDIFTYTTLPTEIQLSATETYANWLSNLTNADPIRRERGSAVFLDVKDNKNARLVFPTNPIIADANTPNKVAQLHSYGVNFVTLMTVHSHPNSTCFSPEDFAGMIYNFEGVESGTVAYGASTQDKNYLVLRTQDSLLLPKDAVIHVTDTLSTELATSYRDTVQLLIDSCQPKSDEEAQAIFNRLMKLSISKGVGSNFLFDITTLMFTSIMTEKFNFGLYSSNKDGNYRRVFSQDIATQIQKFYEDFMLDVGSEFTK